jgi:hypothetical protein
MRPLWDFRVEQKNVLRVQVDGKIHNIALPAIHPSIVLFEVPKGHPAYPGVGVKSTSSIKKGTELAHYAGQVYVMGFMPDNKYSFNAPFNPKRDSTKHSIDALHLGNISRYLNDKAGSKGKAGRKDGENVTYIESEVYKIGNAKFQTWKFVAMFDIEADEELLIDYGENYRKTFMCSHKMSFKKTYDEWICDKLSHYLILVLVLKFFLILGVDCVVQEK